MIRPVIAAAVAALLLVFAGCAGIPGTDQSAQLAPTPSAATSAQVDSAVPVSSPTAVAQHNGPTVPATETEASTVTATAAPARTATPSETVLATATARATPTVVPTPVILAPEHLEEAEITGAVLQPRYWTNTLAVRFTFAASPGSVAGLRPQVELQPLARAFTDIPSAVGANMSPGQSGVVVISLSAAAEGAYHWQARLTDAHGHNGPWADFYQGPAFRLVRTPPEAPTVSSTTHSDQHATYAAPMVELAWTVPQAKGAIQGYQTAVDRNSQGVPSGSLQPGTKTVIGPLANGLIYFHVRAVDFAGNLGKTATYALHIDHRPPVLAHAYFNRFQFNPQFDLLSMSFEPDKTVVLTAFVRRQSTQGIVQVISLGSAVAGKKVTVSWNGRNARGVLVNAGLYTLEVNARDRLGNVGDAVYTNLSVTYKRIVVYLATQQVEAWDGSLLVRSTLATTGNQHLPTPLGVWHVGAKFHPYKFISPWPKTSPFWYPTSGVNYALYFHSGGYFIHDAPWRTVFGPGTNTAPGLPGSGIYAGSHGCVETPTDFATWLYSWAPIGTVVDVVN